MNGIESTGLPGARALPPALPEAHTEPASGGFGKLLQSSLERVGRLQAEADRSLTDLTTGRQTDLHGTMIALEKAGIAFELVLQIRNKLLNAYETLMRQQI
jgi:flagellar hook-basal body complex protein FliE